MSEIEVLASEQMSNQNNNNELNLSLDLNFNMFELSSSKQMPIHDYDDNSVNVPNVQSVNSNVQNDDINGLIINDLNNVNSSSHGSNQNNKINNNKTSIDVSKITFRTKNSNNRSCMKRRSMKKRLSNL